MFGPFHIVSGCMPHPHFGVIGGPVYPHGITHLAAQQPVDRRIGRLARDIPQRVFNRADRRPKGFEPAAHPDPAHHPFHIARVLPHDPVAQLQHQWLHIGFWRLNLAPAGNPLVRGDADHRTVADQSAFQVGDFHGLAPPESDLANELSDNFNQHAAQTERAKPTFANPTCIWTGPRSHCNLG